MAFKQGKSGNPAGRPKGTNDRRTEWRAALEPHGQELMEKALELALDGDAQALRMCLDRLAPPYRPAAEPVAFKLAGVSLTSKAESILAAVATGKLDPQTGKALIDSIAGFAKLAEIDEIRQRLDALEEEDES